MANSAYNYQEFGYAFTQEDGIEYLHHRDGGRWRVARNLEDLVPGVKAFYAEQSTNEILEDVFKATELNKLVVFYHKETSLPPEISNLTNLTSLSFYRCDKLASLPAEIGNLANLTKLDLNGCGRLSALPPEIGNLANLTNLDLNGCRRLSALPPEIGNLTNLRKLCLPRCGSLTFTSLPAEIGNLINLTHLCFRLVFSLTALPAEIGNLTNLTHLDLKKCARLQTLPVEIGNLTNLTHLDLRCCWTLASLPAEIGNLTNLTHLDLRNAHVEIPLEVAPKLIANGVRIYIAGARCIRNLEAICWLEPEFEQLITWLDYHKKMVIK